MNPPIAKRVDHRREHHGDVFVDPYEWLRDKSNPEVINYLKAENDYTENATAPLAELRQKIRDRVGEGGLTRTYADELHDRLDRVSVA